MKQCSRCVFTNKIIPDEGYSRNASCALNLIYTFLLFVRGSEKEVCEILTINYEEGNS